VKELDEARQAWPNITVDAERFRDALLARSSAGAELRVADLYFALGCAAGQPAALAAFEATFVPPLTTALERLGFAPSVITEALQITRETLFVGSDGRALGILGYSGRGSLHAWLRVVTCRVAYKVVGPARKQAVPLEEAIAGATAADVEIGYLKQIYGEAFKDAFRAALAALTVEDRLLLKERYSHDLTVAELGARRGVHASTISRRVTELRTRLVEDTRDRMRARLGLDADEVASALRLIESQMDMTITSAS
jgi:RNA polymerase sigma-70 factor (ECF subfamily)